MADINRNPDERDPEQLAKLLELELMQKRAGWQRNKERHGALRAVSFLFLFLVIVGALVAFYFLFSPDRVNELKATHGASPSPAVSPP